MALAIACALTWPIEREQTVKSNASGMRKGLHLERKRMSNNKTCGRAVPLMRCKKKFSGSQKMILDYKQFAFHLPDDP